MKTIIQTENLCRTYNSGDLETIALDKVSLEIHEGEFTAIVGPSGSGKTTLLNLIGGLDSPTSGKIVIGESDISTMKENKLIDFRLHNIGFIFQSFNLIPVLTAKENVEFVMLLQKRDKKEREARAIELLNEVGLKEKINSRPSQLSGGQQQRVAVARALAPKPAFILADEPTANLDSKAAENLLDIMFRMNQKENMTFLFSTHDPRVIQRAKRVLTLEDGKIVSDIQKN